MEHRRLTADGSSRLSRFELAPPRRFLLPAILLLLSEQPGYGYNLVKDLRGFGFGRVDRPSVYRALARLQADGLVVPWIEEAPTAGQARRVYGLTPRGECMLREWMGVIKEERSCLERVLRRYEAGDSGEAATVDVDDPWATDLYPEWSLLAPSSGGDEPDGPGPAALPRNRSTSTIWAAAAAGAAAAGGTGGTAVAPGAPRRAGAVRPAAGRGTGGPSERQVGGRCSDTPDVRRRFRLVPDRSALLIEARSTVGPISFGAVGLTGSIELDLPGGAVCTCRPSAAHIEVAVDGLRSGNTLYDAELLRRIEASRYPTAAIDLHDADELGGAGSYRVAGEMTFHGVTRHLKGAVTVRLADDGRLDAAGEQVIDIRDFGVASPTVLMLRIYPDVRVRLHVQAEPET